MIAQCDMKNIMVPILFDHCPDFEPRTGGDQSASPDVERIAQLEKENAELQSTNAHLRKEIAWQIEQLTNKIGTIQDQNDRLRGEIDAAKKAENDSRCRWNKEHERTLQRIKELEVKLARRARNQSPPFTFFVI